jgi:hypothetical protein
LGNHKKEDDKDGRKGSVGRRDDDRKLLDLARREDRAGAERGFGRAGGGDRDDRGKKEERRGADERRDDRGGGRHDQDLDRRRRDERPGLGERKREDGGQLGERRRDDLDKKRDDDKNRGRDRDWEEDSRRSGGPSKGTEVYILFRKPYSIPPPPPRKYVFSPLPLWPIFTW